MKKIHALILIAISLTMLAGCHRQPPPPPTNIKYLWLTHKYDSQNTLEKRIAPPSGFTRVTVDKGSFGEWLRYIPLKKGRPTVYLYNGKPKLNQTVHFAVVDIDVGKEDLQQCADAVIRLRAEYLLASKKKQDIHFNFTSGDKADYVKWEKGYRPIVVGQTVIWTKTAGKNSSYRSFRKYLTSVFRYAGTASLEKEMKPVESPDDIQPGDVFIMGGHPGHAVIVLDVAENIRSGKKVFILAQSYMPAQDVHILKNPRNIFPGPWFELSNNEELVTPEWLFKPSKLRRFN